MLADLISATNGRGYGNLLSGISGLGIGNLLPTADGKIGAGGGVSLSDFAKHTADWVTDSMVNMDLANKMNQRDDMESRQTNMMSEELTRLQREAVVKQGGLSSVSNANNYVNNTVFISLRLR